MKKILYWPGIGQNTDILKYFRNEFTNDYKIDMIDFKYDIGDLNPQNWDIIHNNYDWWIGISLGASLAYYSYNYVTEIHKPYRLIIINPFSSRKLLSSEKGFNMLNQWDFSPKEIEIKVKEFDLVSSVFDTKIPTYHGIELLNKTISNNKNIVFVDSTHTIDNIEAQIQLANIFMEKSDKNVGINYCHIYKQYRKI